MLTFILSRGVPTPKYSTNGIFEFDQARALKQAGCNVVFLALDLRSVRRTRPWGFQSFEKDGVPVRVLSVPLGNIPKQIFYPLGQWAFGLLYRRAVREFGRPDVLHAHFTDYGYLACPLARREQLPLVLTEHSSLVNQETLPKDIEQAAKTAFTQADTLIAVSPALAHHMEQHSGRHVEWIPDMVDTELFAYSDRHERQKALEQETDLSEDSGGFSILSCGNLRRIKRMDVLIKAFAQAFRECPQVTLTICGQGEEEGMLRKLIFDLGMTGRIELTGLRPPPGDRPAAAGGGLLRAGLGVRDLRRLLSGGAVLWGAGHRHPLRRAGVLCQRAQRHHGRAGQCGRPCQGDADDVLQHQLLQPRRDCPQNPRGLFGAGGRFPPDGAV